MHCRVGTGAENKREMSSAGSPDVGCPVVQPAPPSAQAGVRSKTADERPLPRTLPATQTVHRTAARYVD